MDGSPPETLYLQERRRRLAAERTLDRTRHELSRAHAALVANADRLSLRYLTQREANLRLTDRQKQVLEARKAEAEKADRARRRLWHALEAMRDGFALFDSSARLVAANSVYLNLFDVESSVGPGASAEDLFAAAAEEGAFVVEEEPDEWVASQLARWSQDVIEVQLLQTFDGRTIRFQDRRAPDGDIVSLAIDISEAQAREESLAAARDAAEEAAKAKAAFLARMSHEMRTPMNGVLGLSELLLEQGIDEDSKSYARTIRDSAEALLVIVNDTLDVSKLDAGRVDLREEPFDLEEMLCDCLRLAAAGKPAEGIAVALDYPLLAPTRFVGDGGRLRQIVMNLVGNGLKFTDAGHVLVRVRVSPDPDGASIAIEVADTGPGIPPDKRDHVFEVFNQIDDGRAQKEGTGLGLTISRGLAEKMGGDIVVADDSPTIGACFRLTVTLPLDQDWPTHLTLPQVVSVPGGTGVQGDVLARRLQDAGVQVVRDTVEGVVLAPSDVAPETAETLARCAGHQRVVLVGARPHAGSALSDRLDDILPSPAPGGALCEALQVGPVAADAPPQPAAKQSTAPRVLIADDNATNRFLLEKMLASEDMHLTLVADGTEAVEAYKVARPDIVLMDISMPQMDGFQATAAIHAWDAAQGCTSAPIIALTAHTGEDIAQELASAGFAEHQTKPVRKPALLAAISEALGRVLPTGN